ncbi:hypothetical protein [Qipengyuania thermophila]|nr:hypothetical protein [Qipengyuania thermophila]
MDREIPYRLAPAANADDRGNRYDTDETVAHIDRHNARLRAACPETRP